MASVTAMKKGEGTTPNFTEGGQGRRRHGLDKKARPNGGGKVTQNLRSRFDAEQGWANLTLLEIKQQDGKRKKSRSALAT
jgi:hypothetical protein